MIDAFSIDEPPQENFEASLPSDLVQSNIAIKNDNRGLSFLK